MEGLGGPSGDPICIGAPPLRVWGRTGLGQPSPLWGPGSCGHRGLDSSLCTGSAGPGHQGSVPGLRQPPGRRLREPFPQLLPRLPVSVSAGSDPQPVLTQPASLSVSPGASARLSCTLSSEPTYLTTEPTCPSLNLWSRCCVFSRNAPAQPCSSSSPSSHPTECGSRAAGTGPQLRC